MKIKINIIFEEYEYYWNPHKECTEKNWYTFDEKIYG
jgi:hypothetical protein